MRKFKFTEKLVKISLEDSPSVVSGCKCRKSFQAKFSIYQMSCHMSSIEREGEKSNFVGKFIIIPYGKYQIPKLLIFIATCWKLENRIKSSPTHEIDFISYFCTSRISHS